jgi:hypothetical protein
MVVRRETDKTPVAEVAKKHGVSGETIARTSGWIRRGCRRSRRVRRRLKKKNPQSRPLILCDAGSPCYPIDIVGTDSNPTSEGDPLACDPTMASCGPTPADDALAKSMLSLNILNLTPSGPNAEERETARLFEYDRPIRPTIADPLDLVPGMAAVEIGRAEARAPTKSRVLTFTPRPFQEGYTKQGAAFGLHAP